MYSPKLVTTQEEYLLALKNVRRLSGGAAEADARHLLEAARRRLAYWDLTEDQIRQLEETGVPQRTLTFYAPASGEVMRKNVAQGQHITAGQALMDLRSRTYVASAEVLPKRMPGTSWKPRGDAWPTGT